MTTSKVSSRNPRTVRIDREKLRAVAQISVRCEPEDVPYVGNCSAHGAAVDRETEAWIRQQLASGNEWAWCHVVVTATFAGASGSDQLGACSYENEAAFRDPSGYYPDMINVALDQLAFALEVTATEVQKVRLRKSK